MWRKLPACGSQLKFILASRMLTPLFGYLAIGGSLFGSIRKGITAIKAAERMLVKLKKHNPYVYDMKYLST